jgi:hypothetical protein
VEREIITSLGREEEDEDFVLYSHFYFRCMYRKYIRDAGGAPERVEFA